MNSLPRSKSLLRTFSTGSLSSLNRAETAKVKPAFSFRWYMKGAIMISVLSLSYSAASTRQLYDTETDIAFWKRCTKGH